MHGEWRGGCRKERGNISGVDFKWRIKKCIKSSNQVKYGGRNEGQRGQYQNLPFSPVHKARKFSAVLGTTSGLNSMVIRPIGCPSAVTSKNTLVRAIVTNRCNAK